jgi:hypothetical protein
MHMRAQYLCRTQLLLTLLTVVHCCPQSKGNLGWPDMYCLARHKGGLVAGSSNKVLGIIQGSLLLVPTLALYL